MDTLNTWKKISETHRDYQFILTPFVECKHIYEIAEKNFTTIMWRVVTSWSVQDAQNKHKSPINSFLLH